ncbi:hypothetical protein ACHAXA_007834 [Cyclostephanos tholiformis]|uniref:Uncharacterized protein n=1 Tax=Cyclostephanos tholiformis TaxID=382380 RepID=A0ABD3SCA9_9STRA
MLSTKVVARPEEGKCTVRRRICPRVAQLSVSAAVLLLSFLNYTNGFTPPLLPPRLCAAAPSPLQTSTASTEIAGITKLRPPIVRIGNNGSSTLIGAKKARSDDGCARDDIDDAGPKGIVTGVFKKSPGAIIIAPFVLIFGLDLIANIVVVTKRSLEVLFTGEYTVWTPWQ